MNKVAIQDSPPRVSPPEEAGVSGSRRYTYADYIGWDDDTRREIIGGKIYMMSAPTAAHQSILGELTRQFANFLRGKPCKVFPAPYDVRLSAPAEGEDKKTDRDVVQPDISIICSRQKRHPEGCRGAPDLVVEILSESNRSHDKLLKFNKYLEAGVREYWIIDPREQLLSINALEETGGERSYRAGVHDSQEQVHPVIFPDCTIDLAEVFAAPDQDYIGI